MVSERVVHAADFDLRREGVGGDPGGFMAHQVFALQVEQFRLLTFSLAPPLLEISAVADVLRDQAVVKGDNQFVINEHIGAARLVFEGFDVEHQLVVVFVKRPATGVFLGDFTTYQPLPDEQITRFRRVHRPVVHPFFRVDDDAVERRTLEGHGLHRLLFPMRIKVTATDQVSAHLLQPLRFNAGDTTGVKFCRLGDFRCGNPFPGLFVERRTGVNQKLHSPCAQVMPGIFRLAANMPEKAGQQGAVEGGVAGRSKRKKRSGKGGSRVYGGLRVFRQFIRGGHTDAATGFTLPLSYFPLPRLIDQRTQLSMHVMPLTHADRREKVFPAGFKQLTV